MALTRFEQLEARTIGVCLAHIANAEVTTPAGIVNGVFYDTYMDELGISTGDSSVFLNSNVVLSPGQAVTIRGVPYTVRRIEANEASSKLAVLALA